MQRLELDYTLRRVCRSICVQYTKRDYSVQMAFAKFSSFEEESVGTLQKTSSRADDLIVRLVRADFTLF